MKTISLDQSIYQITTLYPELKNILHDLGFKDIVKPGMLQTVGRMMTLRKGSMMRQIDIEIIKNQLTTHGFKIMEDHINE